MMPGLEELQQQMQAVILDTDSDAFNGFLRQLRPAAHASRSDMLGVYCHAYRARLADVLAEDLESVARYLGEELFAHVCSGYIDAHPSRVRNARWFSQHAPDFLAATSPFSKWPQVAELASIEIALAEAFDAKEAPLLALDELKSIAPESWGELRFDLHPAVKRLNTRTNAFAIWGAIRAEAEPPAARVLEVGEPLLIWRDGTMPMIRALPAAEALAFDTLRAGGTFAEACVALGAGNDANAGANSGVSFLAGWITSGLLAAPPSPASLSAGRHPAAGVPPKAKRPLRSAGGRSQSIADAVLRLRRGPGRGGSGPGP